MKSAGRIILLFLAVFTSSPLAAQTLQTPPAEANEEMPPFIGSLAGLPLDVWHFVSLDTAMIAGVGLGAAAVAHHWDDDVLEELQEDEQFVSFVDPGNTYGAFVVQAGGSLGIYLAGRVSGHPRVARFGMELVRAHVVTLAWVQAIKVAVHRDRPAGSGFSFPSGHVASSITTAGIVHREFGLKAALPMYGLGAYVAAARIADNHHYLSDVVFGAAVGLASARSLTIGSGPHTWRVAPSAGLRSIGVVVSRARE